jgi:hypothetical protein
VDVPNSVEEAQDQAEEKEAPAVEEAAQPADEQVSEAPKPSMRPEAGATNPKTAAVPTPEEQPGVLGPANPTRDEGAAPVASRPASRVGEKIKRQKALRKESIGG